MNILPNLCLVRLEKINAIAHLSSARTPLDVPLRNVKPSDGPITVEGRTLPKGGCSGAKDSSIAQDFMFKAGLIVRCFQVVN